MTVKPPNVLITARSMPDYNGATWRDVADYAIRLQEWGGACEADKAALREWSQ